MKAIMLKTDRVTHVKIVTVGLAGATIFTWLGLMAHWNVIAF